MFAVIRELPNEVRANFYGDLSAGIVCLVEALTYRVFFLVVAGMNIDGFLVAQTPFKCVVE
ncbi:MAG TPA: hypothetical protein VHR47_10820 [Bacillota bacterium]|nr:hypothetical protein [Bacillota bacterium]